MDRRSRLIAYLASNFIKNLLYLINVVATKAPMNFSTEDGLRCNIMSTSLSRPLNGKGISHCEK